jgi:hypothetical protein
MQESGFHEPYAHYARQLKTWFVAYGIGAPTIFATNERISVKLLHNPEAERIFIFFLCGVALQILSALLNKYSMWYAYQNEIGEIGNTSIKFKISSWYSKNNHTEIIIDLGTICLFMVATYKTLVSAIQI